MLTKKRLFAGLDPSGRRTVEYFVAEEGHRAVAFVLLQITRGRRRPSGCVEPRGVRRRRPRRRAHRCDAAGARRSRTRAGGRRVIRGWWPAALRPPQLGVTSAGAGRRGDDDQVARRWRVGAVIRREATCSSGTGTHFDHVGPYRPGARRCAARRRSASAGRRRAPPPVLLIRTPYGKQGYRDEPLVAKAVERGYAVVVQDVRGRYASDGVVRSLQARRPRRLTTRSSGWPRQPWSNGRDRDRRAVLSRRRAVAGRRRSAAASGLRVSGDVLFVRRASSSTSAARSICRGCRGRPPTSRRTIGVVAA